MNLLQNLLLLITFKLKITKEEWLLLLVLTKE